MSEIGRDLRSVYTDLVKEPLPEHLACIVRKLDKRGGSAH
ncbi:MAG TPA: NepR family anti-sigma factor [Microvirga sp.]|nr:NepR family anti-sigma factor [Microvirga sp.]